MWPFLGIINFTLAMPAWILQNIVRNYCPETLKEKLIVLLEFSLFIYAFYVHLAAVLNNQLTHNLKGFYMQLFLCRNRDKYRRTIKNVKCREYSSYSLLLKVFPSPAWAHIRDEGGFSPCSRLWKEVSQIAQQSLSSL